MTAERGQWILLLDDDSSFRHLLSDLLILHGYSTLEAGSSAEATEAIQVKDPALAIVDYRLPDLNGLNWITSVREAGKTFPIIFLSNVWCDLSLFNRLRNVLGVSLILQKPIEPKLFVEQIADLLPHGSDPNKMLENVGYQYQPGHVDSTVYNLPQLRHSDAVVEALAKARVGFAVELPERLASLTKAAHQAKDKGGSKDVIQEAINEAHKLRGAAGSFGYHEISAMSAKLESLLRNMESDQGSMHDLMWSEINRYLSQAEVLAGAAANEAGASATTNSGADQPRTVVLLGDEKAYADLTSVQANEGFNLHYARTPHQLLELENVHQVHALVIDLSSCSIISAAMLIKALRGSSGSELLPVIVLRDENTLEHELLFLGASKALHKPCHGSDILSAVHSSLQGIEPQLLRVLAVDDDPVITAFVEAILTRAGMLVCTLNEPIKILTVLEEFQPDALLLDVIMPGLSGYDVCRMLRADDKWHNLPILFLTSKSDTEGRNFAFQAGASDFLAKPILADEVIARLKAHITHSPRSRMSHDRDSVTGLLQRAAFVKQLEQAVQNAEATSNPLVFCLIDVNGLDGLRREFGIAAAEKVFATIGETLLGRFRAEDVKAQLADLFVIIFPNKTAAEVEPAMQLFAREVSQRPVLVDDMSLPISISFGLAELYRDTDNDVDLLGIALDRLRSVHGAQR